MSEEPESGTFRISSEPGAGAEDIALVRDGLHRFNFDATGQREVHEVTLFVRDHLGAIRGGLLGYVWGGWLHITDVWVSEECRRGGLGRQLLETAEREAASFGARGAFLSTFDFQAPDFYRRYGYEVYATLPDCPRGHVDFHLRKVF
jgi:ribosomal protein S18 acetylase RimI-like enzyme